MKEHEKISIGIAMGSSVGFLINLLFFDYKISLAIYLSIILICIIIWVCGEYILGIYKDIKKLNIKSGVNKYE